MTFILLLALISLITLVKPEPCKNTRAIYSECDSNSKDRWKVYIPADDSPVVCQVPPPQRVANCGETCHAGQRLVNSTTCDACSAGTFSTGDRMVYETLDNQEHTHVTYLSSKILVNGQDCDNPRMMEDTLSLPTDLCLYTISIPVTLVKSGKIRLSYLFTDDRLFLQVNLKRRNKEQCSGGGDTVDDKSLSPSSTWSYYEMPLNKTGTYQLEITSTAYYNSEPTTGNRLPLQSIRLGKLEVTGVEAPVECERCGEGRVSKEGSGSCEACPDNTVSQNGGKCVPCPKKTYSVPYRYNQCLKQITCTTNDFLPSIGACINGTGTVKAVEVIPGKCKNKLLPEAYKCEMCQPGFELVKKRCEPCKSGKESVSGRKCEACSTNSLSITGIYYHYWHNIPESWRSECWNSKTCWTPAGEFLLGQVYDSYPIVLHFEEVRFKTTVISQQFVGYLTIQFELDCPHQECKLYFLRENKVGEGAVQSTKNMEIIKKVFRSSIDKETQQFKIEKTNRDKADYPWKFSLWLEGQGSFIKVHKVELLNTVRGGVVKCIPCQGDANSCEECPLGMVSDGGKCVECSPNTRHVITGSIISTDYRSTCEPCPPGTMSNKGSTYCFAGCTVEVNSSTTYDLSSLNGVTVFDQPASFPDLKGNTFHYQYQLRVCSTRPDTDPPVIKCHDAENSSDAYSMICQLSVVSTAKGETRIAEAISKGESVDAIIGIEGALQFRYINSKDSTVTMVTLQCNRDSTGDIRMIRSNTSIELVYTGPAGCRLCRKTDYKEIASSCDGGSRNLTYAWLPEVICLGGVALPETKQQECTMYEDSVINSLKRYKIYVVVGIAILISLIMGLLFLCWYSSNLKHRLDGYSRIKYNSDVAYSSSNPMDGTLHFGWEDTDDDEEEVDVVYRRKPSPGARLISKLSKLTQKPEEKMDLMKLASKDSHDGFYI